MIIRSRISVVLVAAAVLACAGFMGCTQQAAPQTPAEVAKADPQSLYHRLGGEGAISKVVDNFVARLAADDRINKAFAHTDIPHLKHQIVMQLCELSGGPEVYIGKDMKTAHKGMNITDSQWDAFTGDLVKSLDEVGVPAEEKEELLVKLTPMKGDIVGQ